MFQPRQQPKTTIQQSPAQSEQTHKPEINSHPLPVWKDVRGTVQLKKYTEPEIIALAHDNYGLELNMNNHGSFIRLLTNLDISWFIGLFSNAKPTKQVEILLALAKKYGSIITETNWEEQKNASQLLKALNEEPLAIWKPDGRKIRSITKSDLTSHMSNEQKIAYQDHITTLLPISGEEGAKKAVGAALFFVNFSYINEPGDGDSYPEYFLQSLQSITEFVKNTYENMDENVKQSYWLEPSGSDRHMDGKQVLFLVNKENPDDRAVYKPRSIAIDDALIGTAGIFHEINQTFSFFTPNVAETNNLNTNITDNPTNLNLVTMGMKTISDRENSPVRLEEFASKKERFTIEEANLYYYQMGALDVASHYLGLTDLHQDNIMPTEKGPLIIDAEIGLFFHETGLQDALHQRSNQLSQPSLASIDIGENGQYRFDTSGTNFEGYYQAGKKAMENKMTVLFQQPEFVRYFFEKTKNLSTRIVPAPTNILAGWYRDYCVSKKFDKAEFLNFMKPPSKPLQNTPTGYLLDSLREDITEGEVNPYFRKADTPVIFPDPEIIPDLIFDSFCRHDIPLFELQMEGGTELTYLLDKVPIGHTTVEFRYKDILGQ